MASEFAARGLKSKAPSFNLFTRSALQFDLFSQ